MADATARTTNFSPVHSTAHCTVDSTGKVRLDLRTMLRSTLAGGAATLTDLAVLFVCVAGLGMSARVASLPALLAGGVVNFFGNRHFAFRATAGSWKRQALLYTLTEAIALTLNGVLFDLAVRLVHPSTMGGAGGVMLLRLVTTNVVFLAFSYPVWRRVFRTTVVNARSHA